VVNAVGASEQVQVRIDWAGGAQTHGVVRRPIQRTDALSTYPEICDRVRAGVAEGLPAAAIAERLNTEGYRPPRGERFGVQAIRVLRRQLGLSGHRPRRHARTGLGPDEWWRTELAHTLGLPTGTLDSWIERGWVRARQEPRGLRRWIVWADAAELERLRQFRQRPLDDAIRQRWLDQQGGPDDETT
jgi:hypothetical protein